MVIKWTHVPIQSWWFQRYLFNMFDPWSSLMISNVGFSDLIWCFSDVMFGDGVYMCLAI